MSLTWPLILKICQYSGFIMTEFWNCVLLYLITTKASSKFGSYKYLMITYSIYSMIYGVVEIFSQSVIHLEGAGFIMFVTTFIKFNKFVANILITLYCVSFGLCIALLTSHFIFRYIAVCRPRLLYLFEGRRLVFLLFPCLIISITWIIIAMLCGMPTEFKSRHFNSSLSLIYHENIDEIGYLALIYHNYNEKGELFFHWKDLTQAAFVCFVMTSLLTIATFCAYKTFKTVVKNKGISSRTKDLNSQLFRALIIQFLVPLITLLIPVGALMTLPMFGINAGELANVCAINAGIYPGLDAFITILLIRDFRTAIFCWKTVRPTATSTHDTTTN